MVVRSHHPATSLRNAFFFRIRENKAKGLRFASSTKAASALVSRAGLFLRQGHLYHVDRGAKSQQMGIKKQLGPIRSHEVPNLSFIRINPNLTPIAKEKIKSEVHISYKPTWGHYHAVYYQQ